MPNGGPPQQQPQHHHHSNGVPGVPPQQQQQQQQQHHMQRYPPGGGGGLMGVMGVGGPPPPGSNPAATGASIQRMLDENAALIKTITECQNTGKHTETASYQWTLHSNLMKLASLADSNLQSLLPVIKSLIKATWTVFIANVSNGKYSRHRLKSPPRASYFWAY